MLIRRCLHFGQHPRRCGMQPGRGRTQTPPAAGFPPGAQGGKKGTSLALRWPAAPPRRCAPGSASSFSIQSKRVVSGPERNPGIGRGELPLFLPAIPNGASGPRRAGAEPPDRVSAAQTRSAGAPERSPCGGPADNTGQSGAHLALRRSPVLSSRRIQACCRQSGAAHLAPAVGRKAGPSRAAKDGAVHLNPAPLGQTAGSVDRFFSRGQGNRGRNTRRHSARKTGCAHCRFRIPAGTLLSPPPPCARIKRRS